MKQGRDGAKEGEMSGPSLSQSLSFGDLRRAIWCSRGFILMAVLVCELLAVLHLMTAPARYPTEMLLAPQQNSDNQASNLSSGLSSAANLLGLRTNLSNSDFDKFRVLYISNQTAAAVDARFHLRQRYFLGWNEQAQRWEMPPLGLFNAPQRLVRWLFGRPVWREPNADDLASVLGDQITIAKRDSDPFVVVSALSRDPKFTESLMMALINAANDILRRRAQQQAVTQIRYLSSQLQTVSITEHRQVLTTLLLGQEQNLMLSRSNLPYAAQVLTPPATHYNEAKPGVTLTLAIGVVVGLLVGIFIAFFREAGAWSRGGRPRDSTDVLRDWAKRRRR